MAYGTSAGVTALVPALGTFSGSSIPTSTQVTAWIAEGDGRINRALASRGYVTPVVSGDAYTEITALSNLYAAAYCLRARGLDTGTGENESRDIIWLAEFERRLAGLVTSDLTLSGVSLVTTGTQRRSRIRSMQLRRIDGYSGANEGSATEYTYPSE